MNAKIAEFSEDAIAEIGGIIEFAREKENIVEEIVDNTKIKALTYKNKKSLFHTYFSDIIKRLVDICAGIVGIVVLVPLTIIIFIANKLLKDKGSIFYTQERIGKDGKIFKMLKYRTMIVGADEKLKEYLDENEEARKEYKIYKKLKFDPRVTKIGEFLRKTSLDEMPQLLHLLTRRNVFSRT